MAYKTRDLTAAERAGLDKAHEEYTAKAKAAKTTDDIHKAWAEHQQHLEKNNIIPTLAGYRYKHPVQHSEQDETAEGIANESAKYGYGYRKDS